MSMPDQPRLAAAPVLLVYGAAGLAGAALCAWLLTPVEAAFAIAFWGLALAVVHVDLDRFLIPDTLALAIALLGLARAATAATILGDELAPALGWSLVQGAGAFAVVWAVRRLYGRFAGREGIGFGDVKLAGALGIWLGPIGQAVALETAALAALVLVGIAALRGGAPAGRATAVPFGAFLAPAAVAAHVAGLAFPDFLGALS